MVRVFSTPTCAYCVTLKQFLEENNIDFQDIDVSKDEGILNEMIEKSNQMGVPVVDIDGEFIVGFDKAKIMQLLKIKE
jgi:glutaredoxin 3